MQNRNIAGMVLVVIFMNLGLQTLVAEQNKKIFSYDGYASVLKAYVDDNGMVNYKQLKANRVKLDTFVEAMSKLEKETYGKWGKKAKIAFWLNAFNINSKSFVTNLLRLPSDP